MRLFYSTAIAFTLAALIALLGNANSARPMVCDFHYAMLVCK